jgi:hypothetical protein
LTHKYFSLSIEHIPNRKDVLLIAPPPLGRSVKFKTVFTDRNSDDEGADGVDDDSEFIVGIIIVIITIITARRKNSTRYEKLVTAQDPKIRVSLLMSKSRSVAWVSKRSL